MKLGHIHIRAVFSIKSRESTKQLLCNCNFFSTSFRIDYLQLNLLHSFKTCIIMY